MGRWFCEKFPHKEDKEKNMAANNQVVLGGFVIADPKMLTEKMGKFPLSVGRKVKDKWENMVFDVKYFGKVTDSIMATVTKGTRVRVKGTLDLEEWNDKVTGLKRQKYAIVCWEFDVVEPSKSNTNQITTNDVKKMFNADKIEVNPAFTADDIPF